MNKEDFPKKYKILIASIIVSILIFVFSIIFLKINIDSSDSSFFYLMIIQ